MIDGYAIHGHAIVSGDDCIADHRGLTPDNLRIESDWQRFQAALDGAVVTILGRRGHEVNPNTKGRNRVVVSSSASGVERRGDAWWWNPKDVMIGEALATAAPTAGTVAVPGGRRVFDLFLSIGFDAFHLVRVPSVCVPDGVPIFSKATGGMSADAVLEAHGLVRGSVEVLEAPFLVECTEWSLPRRLRGGNVR